MGRRLKHGMCGTSIYHCWHDMKRRCSNPNNCNYKHYGALGIKVCEEWQGEKGFENFVCCVSKLPHYGEKGYSLDRINVNGDYEPSNVRWANKSVQNANRRNVGACEYIGVWKHSNNTIYCSSIRQNNKLVFLYCSPSKNECAKKRNEYIVLNNLDYPLNEIREEYEDVCKHKYFSKCTAISKNDNSLLITNTISEMSRKTNLSEQFIRDCINGRRNSRSYLFLYERRKT